MKLILGKIKQFLMKHTIEVVALGVVAIFAVHFYSPAVASAVLPEEIDPYPALEQILDKETVNELKPYGHLPQADDKEPLYTMNITASAYNSVPWQTDSTPWTTASGTTCRHGVVASNYFPIGTQLRMPELYGDQIFIVEDRMNPRYYKRMDIWMEEIPDARQFGLQNVYIEVYN